MNKTQIKLITTALILMLMIAIYHQSITIRFMIEKAAGGWKLTHSFTILEAFDRKWKYRHRFEGFHPKIYKCGKVIGERLARGRLGDQLFYIASLLAFAHSQKMIPYLPNDKRSKDKMDLLAGFDSIAKLLPLYKGNKTRFKKYENRKPIRCGENLSQVNYPFSWAIHNQRQFILSALRFNNDTLKSCRKAIDTAVQLLGYENRRCVLVAGHVRRDDMMVNAYAHTNTPHKPASADFLKRAYHMVNDRLRDEGRCSMFIFVGDDPRWTKLNLPKRPNIMVMKNDVIVDLCILASAEAVIFTTGGYGLWGALLADSQLVVRQGNSYLMGYNLPNWISLDACSGRNLTDAELHSLGNAECWPPNTFSTGPDWCYQKKICFYTMNNKPEGYPLFEIQK